MERNQSVRVLVVDDSKVHRKIVSSLLSTYLFDVIEAKDGVEALDILKKNSNIKLVITDYNMPKMDGFELTTDIRKSFDKDSLCIVAVSSNDSKDVASKFIKYGANDYITKPFTKEEFYCRINQNIELLESISAVREINAKLEERVRQRTKQVLRKAEELREKAIKDDLTGTFNRNAL